MTYDVTIRVTGPVHEEGETEVERSFVGVTSIRIRPGGTLALTFERQNPVIFQPEHWQSTEITKRDSPSA